jgi:hypothetical protein
MTAIMRISILRIVLAFLCEVALSGCHPSFPILTGQQFQFQENTKSQMAQVYIYRTLSPPTQRSPDVMINGKKYFDLKAGGFGKILLSPGEMLIETKWNWDTGVEDKSVSLLTEPGQTYFVRCHTEMWGMIFQSTLKVVRKITALDELEGLKEFENLSNQ